jgi:hypothetical protein
MWIRSQDRKRLVKTRDIRTYQSGDMYFIWSDNNCRLGEYSSYEKALKVLDMIQEHIKNMYIGIGNYMGKPFQMPQDDEVEE